jgi:hypothetical protein
MNRHRLGSCLFVALAAFMVLGHICTLPFHAHAGAITTHEESQSHHGGQHPDDDAAHAGSCEAAKSAPVAIDTSLLPTVGTVVAVVQESADLPGDADGAVVLGSPPLFLLHASLLI